MQKTLLLSIFVLAACASTPRGPAMVAPEGALELEQALHQGIAPTLVYLRSQTSGTGYEGLDGKDPAKGLPDSLKAAKAAPLPPEKIQRQSFLRQFRNWSSSKKIHHGESLISTFTCEKALESQALGLSLELDFPEPQALQVSQNLHEKVLACPDFPVSESLFRLTVFSIQRGDCTKAQSYLKSFPQNKERGFNDRISYLHSLCSENQEVTSRNPWGGYGILLGGPTPQKSQSKWPSWYLATKSGSPEWDRLLISFIELSEKGKSDTIRFLASKLDYEKFRSLPLPFQTSLLTLLNFNGADLSVFQTLHRYLADHPEMISPPVVGLLFPVRFWKEIVENTKSTDPILVKALIRQESAFNPAARSPAKAAGLMQLIYPTARAFGMKSPQLLFNPNENIQAGSEFLARLISDFGSVELALAAYNAGPAIVRQWQRRYPTNNVNLFVEMIPYTETREYVRLVTRNYKIYQSILVKPQVLGDFR